MDCLDPDGEHYRIQQYEAWGIEQGVALPLWNANGKIQAVFEFYGAHVDLDIESFEKVGQAIMSQLQRSLEHMQRVVDLEKIIKDTTHLKEKRSEFIDALGFDVRAPLSNIMGLTGLLKKNPGKECQQDYLEMIHSSSQLLIGILDDVLEGAKVDSKSLPLIPLVFHPQELLDPLLKTFSLQAHEKGIELVVKEPLNFPYYLSADIKRIRQMIASLMNHSFRVTQRGFISIEVSCDVQNDKDALLRVSIEDSGLVLNRHQSTSQSVKEGATHRDGDSDEESIAHGFSMANQLASLLGAQLDVDVQKTKGKTFDVIIPCHISQETETSQVDQLAEKLVLLIQPFDLTRRTTLEALKSWGLNVVSCKTGQETKSHLKNLYDQGLNVDYIVCEQLLADMSGVELLSHIHHMYPNKPFSTVLYVDPVSRTDTHQMIAQWEANPLLSDRMPLIVTKPMVGHQLKDFLMSARDRQKNADASLGIVSLESEDLSSVSSLRSNSQYRSTQELPEKLIGKVLIVEDSKPNQVVLKKLLEIYGLEVEVVGNGILAIDRVMNQHFDLVLMDCLLPEMDGFEATQIIRTKEHDSGVRKPIIALSACATENIKQQCIQAGMDEFISKPFDETELIEAISRYLLVQSPHSINDHTGENSEKHPAANPEKLEGFDAFFDETLSGLGQEQFDDLRRSTLNNVKELFRSVDVAVDNKDLSKVGASLKRFQTCALAFGASDLVKQMNELDAVRKEGFEGFEVHLEPIQQKIKQFCVKLEAYDSYAVRKPMSDGNRGDQRSS